MQSDHALQQRAAHVGLQLGMDSADTSSTECQVGRGSSPGHLPGVPNSRMEGVTTLSCKSVQGKDMTAEWRDAIQQHLVKNGLARDTPNALMAIDVAQLERQAGKWRANFPRVQPFYAVKSLPDPVVLSTLVASGVNFDCASSAEIDAALEAGATPERIIFANPVKFPGDIKHAREVGVRKMTFDNDDELEKVATIFPDAEVVLRIVTDDSKSVCRLSNKYGAAIEDCSFLLERAKELRLKVIGVSFHVGSGSSEPTAFVDALRNARKVFDIAIELGLSPFRLLDIGGGFPGDDDGVITTKEIADVVNAALDQLFPGNDVEIISEPGRFFSHSSATLAARVIARRKVRTRTEEDPEVLYYIGDGVYGSFNCMLYDHYTPALPEMVPANESGLDRRVLQTRVFGPTCDGLDTIYDNVPLPHLDIGDFMVFRNMGAYTIAASSRFNGINRTEVTYVSTQ